MLLHSYKKMRIHSLQENMLIQLNLHIAFDHFHKMIHIRMFCHIRPYNLHANYHMGQVSMNLFHQQ